MALLAETAEVFKGEELTAGAVASWRVVGTVFLMCLMETGPAAGVGFSLMAGSVTRVAPPCKGNFGEMLRRRGRCEGRGMLRKRMVWRMGMVC